MDRIVAFIVLFIALGIALISTTLVVRNIESHNRVDEAYEDCLKFLIPSECRARMGE